MDILQRRLCTDWLNTPVKCIELIYMEIFDCPGTKGSNMAKKATKSEALQKLKNDLKAGDLGCAYIFHGEESYLREYYLGEVRNQLIPAGFEDFNYHKLEGKDLTVQSLAEMAEAMPMMAERRL